MWEAITIMSCTALLGIYAIWLIERRRARLNRLKG